MYCHNCGFNNSDGVLFCANCGASMEKTESRKVIEPEVEKKKGGLAGKVIAVVLVFAIAASLFIFMGSKDTKPYIVYFKDNQMYLAFEGEESILLDDELIKGYNMLSDDEKNAKKRNIANDLLNGFENKIIYREFTSTDPVEYDFHLLDVTGGKIEEIPLPYQIDKTSINGISHSRDYSKIYFEYERNIYQYDFDSMKKLAVDVYQRYYCQDSDRIIYTKENNREGNYNKDLYFIDEQGESFLIDDDISMEYTNSEKNVFVYSKNKDIFYTYINGEKKEVVIPSEIKDNAEDVSVSRAFEDGTLLISVYKKVNGENEWSYYLSKNNEYELIPYYTRNSDDGKAIFYFERTAPEDSGAYYGKLTKYNVDGVKVTKAEQYNDVYHWEMLDNNEVLIWKNKEKVKEGIYVYDLYYKDSLIATDVYRYNEGGAKGNYIYLTFVSEDYIMYFTDPHTSSMGRLLFTVNIFDGKESKEIAHDVLYNAKTTADGRIVFVGDFDSDNNTGNLTVYDGKSSKVIASGVSEFYSPDLLDGVKF